LFPECRDHCNGHHNDPEDAHGDPESNPLPIGLLRKLPISPRCLADVFNSRSLCAFNVYSCHGGPDVFHAVLQRVGEASGFMLCIGNRAADSIAPRSNGCGGEHPHTATILNEVGNP